MPWPLRARELDQMNCEDCDCRDPHRLSLVNRCHPKSGLRIAYFQSTRCLEITCWECDELVDSVEVAH